MIEFEGVTFTYPDQARPAIQSVSLEIADGSLVLVAGLSGSGKSTLLRCINGLVPHFSGGELKGRILVNGFDPVALGPQRMSVEVGFVFQDPEMQFVVDRVEDEIAFALENFACPVKEMHLRVNLALDLLELQPLRNRYKNSLSGGEQQKVVIAAALALQPRILILDEPTSQLDPQSAHEVLNALLRLNQEHGLTILLSEHRFERVLPFVNQMVYLDVNQPGLVTGTPGEVFEEIVLAPPVVQLGRALRWQPRPLLVEDALPFASKVHLRQPDLPDPPLLESHGEEILEVNNLRVSLDHTPVLQGLSLKLHKGECLVVMGANGAGKTTLLRSLVGLVRPESGQIMVCGEDIRQKETAEICKQVAYLPQDPRTLLFADRVLDELLITLRNHKQEKGKHVKGDLTTEADISQAMQLIEQLGLADLAEAYPRDLSVGQRQRVALGAIMVHQPEVLLLDEPTRGLDSRAKQALVELLQGWQSAGIAVLLVTHDVELAAACADRVAIVDEGRILAEGAPEKLLAQAPFIAQMAQLFPGAGCLTVEAVLERLHKQP